MPVSHDYREEKLDALFNLHTGLDSRERHTAVDEASVNGAGRTRPTQVTSMVAEGTVSRPYGVQQTISTTMVESANGDVTMLEATEISTRESEASRPPHDLSHTALQANAEAGPSRHTAQSAYTTTVEPSVVNGTNSSRPSPGRPIPRTCYTYDPQMMLHCKDGYTPTDALAMAGDGHPEEPMRIKRIYDVIREAGLIGKMHKIDYMPLARDQALLVHSADMWDANQATEGEAFLAFDSALTRSFNGRANTRHGAIL